MLWLIFVLAVYGFAGPPVWFYNVPSGSMADTLLVGDIFAATTGAYVDKPPQRGDVAVFDRDGTTYVKRVIGLPGDRVQMTGGRLILNGQPVERARGSNRPTGDTAPGEHRYLETLPNGVSYETLKLEEDGPLDGTPVFEVPSGQYFVLGDNRDNSTDSRLATFGYIPRDHFVGRAVLLLFSVSPETGELRDDRFLQPIR